MPKADPIPSLAKVAAALPRVEQGIACEGTAVESRTFKIRGKAFLFLRRGNAMVKLEQSITEANDLGKSGDTLVRAGAGGWTTIKWDDTHPAPMAAMKRWIRESYELQAGAEDRSKPKKKPTPRKAAKKKPRG
jgi:hypothetical protein